MIRVDNFTLRVNADERQLITALAQRLERTESDTIRMLVRREARELGVTSTAKTSPRAANAPA